MNKQQLIDIGQEHIANLMDENKLLNEKIEKIDFKQILNLYKEAQINKESEDKIIERIKYTEKDKLKKQEYEHLEDIGSKIISDGKYAVVTMAGGQGTRLGHNGPKGTYKISLNSGDKYLFEIVIESLKKANQKYNTVIPWYIMTSKENNDQTVQFLEQHNFFGYPSDSIMFFKQGELPLIDKQGKLILQENGCIKEASDGNGGIYEAMIKNGVLDNMHKKGIEWVMVGGIDNILLNIADPAFIGLTVSENNIIGSKSVVRSSPKEKVGVFCKINGRPGIIEYIELPEKMAEETDANGNYIYGDVNILNHLFNIKALEKIGEAKLPYHAAIKKSPYLNENGEYIIPDESNAYKFESFIFDAFKQFDDMTIFRVKRNEEFAPIKNAEGADSPETARELYNNLNK